MYFKIIKIGEVILLLNDNKSCLLRAFYLVCHGCYIILPNPHIRCVIVLDNKIVGKGYYLCVAKLDTEINICMTYYG
ncbi:hypothetical protein [Blochmannia endosymbiont of Camponotus (Colobopsis) obliquus]|uniref:hypothetical protein n=1 Tax=Blochmannia endosymbiont of Camponotus (Colobopsis) obliquus TaxID=1505597 RepID=UPI00061AFA6F|nr:hypothetical protein [Blochmannia endosymbiont of Camponotus (Colobopsis) obliquus]